MLLVASTMRFVLVFPARCYWLTVVDLYYMKFSLLTHACVRVCVCVGVVGAKARDNALFGFVV